MCVKTEEKRERLVSLRTQEGSFQVECSMVLVVLKEIEGYII